MPRRTDIIALALLALLAHEAFAAPVHIEADRAQFDEKKGISQFQGNVRLTRDGIVITAERISLFQTTEGRLRRAVAEGTPATFSRRNSPDGGIQAEARRIEYIPANETLHLIGAARLSRGQNRFTGERITYHIRDDRVEASGGEGGKGRVRATLYPEEPQP